MSSHLRRLSASSCRRFLCPQSQSQLTGSQLQLRPHPHSSLTTSSSSSVNDSSRIPQKWDLYASVCLERKPVLTQEMKPLEKKYAAFLAEYELESSQKSDHEIRHEKDKVLIEQIKKGEVDQGNIQTAQDMEDAAAAELLKFVPMSRVTDADKEKDTKSLNRALDSHLLLLVEQKLGKDYKWICPQLRVKPGETLRQTAERVLEETCPEVKAKVLGNAPWGIYKYKYPKGTKSESGNEVTGAKVFFYKANYLSGNLGKDSKPRGEIQVKDFHWLTRTEMEARLYQEYHRKISQFLVPED